MNRNFGNPQQASQIGYHSAFAEGTPFLKAGRKVPPV